MWRLTVFLKFCFTMSELGEQWQNAFLSLCATFKRAVITTKEKRHACFWRFAIINLSQDSFVLSVLYSFLTWITTFAQLAIVFAMLTSKTSLSPIWSSISMGFYLFKLSKDTAGSENKLSKITIITLKLCYIYINNLLYSQQYHVYYLGDFW